MLGPTLDPVLNPSTAIRSRIGWVGDQPVVSDDGAATIPVRVCACTATHCQGAGLGQLSDGPNSARPSSSTILTTPVALLTRPWNVPSAERIAAATNDPNPISAG